MKTEQDTAQYLLDQVSRLIAENAMLKEKWLAQPEQEQEPVATKLESHQFTAFHVSADDFKKLQKLPTGTKIYTAPPKREPLSIQEIYDLDRYSQQPFEIYTVRECISWIRKVEKAHGIGGGE